MRVGTDPATGAPRRRSWTFEAKTRAAAERKVRAIVADLEDEPPVSGSNVPVAQLLADWNAHCEVRGRSPKTIFENERIIRQVLVPAFGPKPLEELTGRDIDRFYDQLMKGGKSPSTVKRYHAVLSAALSQAVKWGWLSVSPMVNATPPEIPRRSLKVPTLA